MELEKNGKKKKKNRKRFLTNSYQFNDFLSLSSYILEQLYRRKKFIRIQLIKNISDDVFN